MIIQCRYSHIIHLVFFSFLFFCSCSYSNKPYSADLAKINNQTCYDLKLKYGMKCVGRGLGLNEDNDRVATIYIRFSVKKLVYVDEARIIALDALKIMLKNVTVNESFLSNYAVSDFNETNIDMSIFFENPNGDDLFDPYLEVVSMRNGNIDYATNDPENTNRYKTEIKETLEEAREKVNSD